MPVDTSPEPGDSRRPAIMIPVSMVLVSPDSLKGSLGALAAAEAIAAGFRDADPNTVVIVHPVSYGG